MNRTASAIVLVTLVGCGGSDPPSAQPTAAGCVAGTERMTIVSGDGQTAPPGALLPERPTARATCESFTSRGTTMPLAGAAAQWWVISGDGSINGATTVPTQLDADGTTSVAWTLPNAFGRDQALRVALAAPNPPVGARFSATVASSTTTAQSCSDAGGTEHGASTVIAADAAWTAAGSPHRGDSVTLTNDAVLEIEQGALVCVGEIDRAPGASGRVVARGSASAPIRFRGTALRAPIELSHVEAENVPALGSEAHPAWSISDSSFRWTVPRDPAVCAQVIVAAGGAVRRTVIEGYGSQSCAALRLAGERSCDFYYCYGTSIEARIVDSLGDGVSIDTENDVSFTNCQVSSSEGHGIVVAATSTGPVTADGCNLFDNGGHAIANRSIGALAAPGNWWGDPAGPSGPSGDGTSGMVDAANPRAGPLALGY